MGQRDRGIATSGAVAERGRPSDGTAAGAAGAGDGTLREHVRDALAHLHDVPYLQVHLMTLDEQAG